LWLLYAAPEGENPRDAALDLQRDRGIALIDRLFFLPQILLTAFLFGFGWWIGGTETALAWIVWGIGVRTTAVYHTTWAVNSAAHTWGYRTYDTPDRSTNLLWLSWISAGEGWHNNHHHNQRAANHGRRWWELDLTFRLIQILSLVGLARDIKTADP
jgi:stearoyl-CoA desaturase (delta-9 desaturase)